MAPAVGHEDGEADHSTVFIDTSLDTRLAMIFSESETVSDFKKKIVFEHRKMFPAIGDIKIECLKVKKRGNFFHLIDSMPVKRAFDATKRDLFLSADASRLEQNDGIQHSGKHTAGDHLALPWVTHSCSIERHANHGSPSIHSKVVPFENTKVLNADQFTSGDSCKDVSKNVEEDRSCNDKLLDHELQEKLYTVHMEDISSKKRTRDVHKENSLNDAFASGPSAKKKRRTQRVKSDVKASEENIASTYDDDKVNDKAASINNDDLFEHKSKGKDLVDENNRINKVEKCSDLDQVATVTGIEGVGSENVDDVAMVVENNIQQEMSPGISRQEKDSVLVRKSAMENEIDSSLMSTPDCELDAAGLTATGHKKRLRKLKAVKKDVFPTSFTKKLRNTNNDSIKSSQQAVGSNGQECADDQIDKYKDDIEVSLNQRPELKLPERKKGNMGCENIVEGKRRKRKKRSKDSDNLLGDISSTVSASVTDERKMNEDLERTLMDAKKSDDVTINEVEVSVENTDEKSRNELTDTNDAATVTNEENVFPHSESLMNNGAEQKEKTDDTMKKKKKKKSKKSAGRNEDESIAKHVDGDIFENVKEGESGLPDADKKEGDMSSKVFDSVMDERKTNEDSGKLLLDAKKADNVFVNEVDISMENTGKKLAEVCKDTNDVTIVTNEENLLPHSESLINNDVEVSTEKTDDTMKKKKKKKKKSKKSAGRNEDESITKHVDGDIFENVNEGESGFPDVDKKGDMSSTVFDSVMDEIKTNEDSGKLLLDAKKGDNVFVNEVDISMESMGKKLGEGCKDTNDVAIVTNEENLLPHSESLMTNDVEVLTEKRDDTMKKKKKKKSKKSAGGNEDESITKHVDGDIYENVKEGESGLPVADRKEGDMSSTVFDSVNDEKQMNEVSGKSLLDAKKGDDVIENEVDISVEKMGEEFKDTNDVAIVTNEENLLPHSESLMTNDVEVLTEKRDDTMKKKKKKKSKKSAGGNEDESITKHVDGDIFENVKEGESGLPVADRKEGDMSSTVFDSVNDEKQMNEVSGESLLDAKKGDDDIVNEVHISVENMGEEFKDTNDVAIVTNEENLLPHSESLMTNDVEVLTEKRDDTMKKKKKKKSKKSAGGNEDESITKHVDGDIFENVKEGESGLPVADRKEGDMSSTVFDSVNDEKQMNEVSGKSLLDAKKGDDVIVNEVDISVENMEKKLGEEFKDTNDVATETNKENLLPHAESLMNNDAEVSAEKNLRQVNAQGILDDLEKQNEKTDDTLKKKKKKKTKKSSVRNEDESIAKHVNGDICENVKEIESRLPDADRKDGDTSVLDSVNYEKQINEVSGKTLIDADKGDDVIVNEVGISVENMEEKLKELKDVNDVATVTNEENNVAHSLSLVNNDDEKQNEKMDDMKKKKKKKTKKSAGRNEGESIAKHANHDVCENVEEDGGSFSDVNRIDGPTSLMVLASAAYEMNKNSGKTSTNADKGDDVIVNEVGILENMEEKRKEFADVNDVATVTNEEIITGKNISQVNEEFENQNEKMGDTMKKNKKRKTRKSAERLEDESITKHVNRDISENIKEGESNKDQGLPVKHQSAEVELESTKSQSVDHHHLPEKTLKDVSVDYFALGHQPKKKTSVDSRKVKNMMKTKDDSRKDQSQKLVSKNVNNKVSSNVLKDPNITNNEIKTRQRTKNIVAQKTNKQQSNVGQTHARTVQKKNVNPIQLVKRLLNAPGTIFGDDTDDNATANSDSSTRTLSEKLSSSSSSSGESAYIIQSRRNGSNARIGKESIGKNNTSSERGKLNYLLRSASSFKKVKSSALSQMEDTESQPVDFVPESQPMGK